jgi:hypothetical protein
VWGIPLNRVEIESFFKSFILFFVSLELLIAVIFYMEYQQDVKKLEQRIFSEMKICSFDLKCPQYSIDFQNKKEKQLYTLYQDKTFLYSYYLFPTARKYHLKISYSKLKYQDKLVSLKIDRTKQFGFTSIVVLLLTIVFSLYAMYPLRSAFKLTQEFIKDILHDFNTPISAIILNVKMIAKNKESYTKINRIEQSIDTLLSLQDNLKSYLNQNLIEQEKFDAYKLLEERIEIVRGVYSNITFSITGNKLYLNTNKASISRIFDNILSNAGKYNQEDGTVYIEVKQNSIVISDTGKGIQNVNKIFDRFYKEHDRGLGIGLHIVKKLCDELSIKIRVQSEFGVGSSFYLMFD